MLRSLAWLVATQLDSVGPSHGFSSADSGLDQSESSLIPQNIEYLLISSLKTSGKLPVLASFVVQVTSKVVRREFSNLLPSSSVCGTVYGACMQSQAWEPHLSHPPTGLQHVALVPPGP